MNRKNGIVRHLSNAYGMGMSHIMCYPWSLYRFSDILVNTPNARLNKNLSYSVLHNQVILSNKPNINFLTQFKELGEYIYMDLTHPRKYTNVISPATMLSIPFIELNKSIFLYANTMKYFPNQETKRMTIDYYLTTSICYPHPTCAPFNPIAQHRYSPTKKDNQIHIPCILLDVQNMEEPRMIIYENNKRKDTFTLQKNEGILYSASCYNSVFEEPVLINKKQWGKIQYLSAVAKILDEV